VLQMVGMSTIGWC